MRRLIAVSMLLSLLLFVACGEDNSPGDTGQTGITENEDAEQGEQDGSGGEGEAESETEVETEIETDTEGEGDTGEGAEENDDGVDL